MFQMCPNDNQEMQSTTACFRIHIPSLKLAFDWSPHVLLGFWRSPRNPRSKIRQAQTSGSSLHLLGMSRVSRRHFRTLTSMAVSSKKRAGMSVSAKGTYKEIKPLPFVVVVRVATSLSANLILVGNLHSLASIWRDHLIPLPNLR